MGLLVVFFRAYLFIDLLSSRGHVYVSFAIRFFFIKNRTMKQKSREYRKIERKSIIKDWLS